MAFDILSRVKQYLKLTSTTNDDFLLSLIGDVSAEIESYLGQPIEQIGVILKKLQIINGDTVIVPYTVPVVLLQIEYTIPFENSYSVMPTTDYEYFYEGYVPMIWFRNRTSLEYTLRITTLVGYEAADIPLEILNVATEMVAMKFKESVVGENILGKQTVGTSQSGTSSTTAYKDMLSVWYKRLIKYKILPS